MSSVQKIELQHNTPEQVAEYVDAAVAIVTERVPLELRGDAVLAKVLELLSGKTIQFAQPQPIDLGRIGIDPSRLRSGH